MTEKVEGIVLVPKPSQEYLNDHQLVDYRDHRRKFVKWALNMGKDPKHADGYAHSTVRQRAYRLDKFYRWVWDERDGYTLEIRTDHADNYMNHLVYQENTTTYNASCQKAIKLLFKWKSFTHGQSIEWEPQIKFTQNTGSTQPRDFLTRKERRKVGEAALEHGTIPHYNSLTPEQRDQWKIYLAQRFGKPKSEIGLDDWKRANSWKIPSLTWVSLDAGFRPVEVGRAKTSWVDLENGILRIPREDSSKNEENWSVSLRDRTVNLLEKWLAERETREKYGDSDKLWLTRKGNPYNTQSLNALLDRLCETAEIPTEGRDVTWYSIRHSVGTYMAREEGLAAAQAQLRHKSEQTTMKYDQVPVEERKDALDRMG